MEAQPNSSSAVHHHGDQDTIVYALHGKGQIAYGPDSSQRLDVLPGDHALIPAYTEHQEINPGSEKLVWVIIRSGSKPITENIEDWGQSESK
ncbi:hypothetical protein CBS101457_006866 [Exobasidium rhododendri]|nr:hypothetical protein CBS101457_006866 [Exobasidium rhododendri]